MVPVGRLYGLPELPGDGCWIDIAGAAALTGAPPRTITSWLARGGPFRNPFPVPQKISLQAVLAARRHRVVEGAGEGEAPARQIDPD